MGLAQNIKRAVLSLAGKDVDPFSKGQVEYNGKVADIELQWPYGFSANPPEDSLILMLNVQGQEENRVGFANYPQKRFMNLKPGEVQIGNYLTGTNVKFLEDGSMVVTAINGMSVVVAPDLNITVAGDLTVVVGGAIAIGGSGGSVDLNFNDSTVNMYGNYHLGGPGGAAVARVGDTVVCPAGTGHITTGSSSHTAT